MFYDRPIESRIRKAVLPLVLLKLAYEMKNEMKNIEYGSGKKIKIWFLISGI
jgi:hypothetical protein